MNPQSFSELPLQWPVPAGDAVLVGVSGGPDSVALLHRLSSLGLWPLRACHLDHGWREQSQSDAAYVADLAQSLNIPLHIERQNVPRQEEAARDARLAFFRRTAEETGAHWVALAHTADDQAETILMRLIRGSVRGLGGIRATRPLAPGVTLVRPWLHVRRHQILDYCERHRLFPRLDPSNQDPAYLRNRIRQQILPVMVAENPRLIDHLSQLAEIWQDDNDYLDQQAQLAFDALLDADGAISVQGLLALPVALQRRVVVRQLAKPSALQVAIILALAQSPQGSGEAPEAFRSGDRLWLGHLPASPEPLRLPLQIGVWPLPAAGWLLTVQDGDESQVTSPREIALDVDHLTPDLVFRYPETGDRFRPERGAGDTSLAKYLGGLGLSQPERARTLVLAQGHRVWWVIGLRRAAMALATPQSRRIIKVSATRTG